jgi:hypothetical protein
MDDWRQGLKMLKAGKLRLRVPRVADRKDVARLFEKSAARQEEAQ